MSDETTTDGLIRVGATVLWRDAEGDHRSTVTGIARGPGAIEGSTDDALEVRHGLGGALISRSAVIWVVT